VSNPHAVPRTPQPAAGRSIRPTRRGWGALVAGISLTLLGLTSGAAAVGPAGLLVLALVALAAGYGWWRVRQLRWTPEPVPSRVVVGQQWTVGGGLSAGPGGGGTVQLSLADAHNGHDATATRIGRIPTSVHLEQSVKRRGRMDWEPFVFVVLDPFGLVQASSKGAFAASSIALPHTHPLPPIPLSVAGGTAARDDHPHGESPFSFHGGEPTPEAREYRSGDDLRHVHWPATAKSGEPMVRVEDSPSRPTVTVLLDTRSRSYQAGSDGFELAVSATASLVRRILHDGHSVQLNDQQGVPLLSQGGRLNSGRLDPLTQLALVTLTSPGGPAPSLRPAGRTAQLLITGTARRNEAQRAARRGQRVLEVGPGLPTTHRLGESVAVWDGTTDLTWLSVWLGGGRGGTSTPRPGRGAQPDTGAATSGGSRHQRQPRTHTMMPTSTVSTQQKLPDPFPFEVATQSGPAAQ